MVRYSFSVVDLHHLLLAGFAGAPLMRFSISPRAQYSSSYNAGAAHSGLGNEVTIKRGFAPFSRCSALATTRRARYQLSRV